MNQSIRFSGLSLTPDEQAANNGALSLCGGVELHDGALRPSVLTGTPLNHPLTTDGTAAGNVATLLYVHETTAYRHLIASYTEASESSATAEATTLYWYQRDGSLGGTVHAFEDGISITSIQSIGNTLVIIASDGIHYVLWKNTDAAYKYLGQKPPFLTVEFAISDNYAGDYETGGIDIDGSDDGFYWAFQQTTLGCDDALTARTSSSAFSTGEKCIDFKSAKQSDVTESIWALINRTNNYIAQQGHFYANFFVRYCYRLYDGSMVMHSAPVFMPVLVPHNYKIYLVNAMSTDTGIEITDKLTVKRTTSKGEEMSFTISRLTFRYYPRNVSLWYRMSYADTINALKEWSDIVKSVDVFISEPVTSVDTSALIKTASIISDDYAAFAGPWADNWIDSHGHKNNVVVDIPCLSNEAYSDKIANVSTFFRIHSFPVEDLEQNLKFTDLPADKTAIANVTTQEQMTDDYKTHNFVFPSGSYVYNHRLNVYGAYEKLFNGFDVEQMFSPYAFTNGVTGLNASNMCIKAIYVVLSTDDGYKCVRCTIPASQQLLEAYAFVNMPKFYPDARAVKMILEAYPNVMGTTTTKFYVFNLKPHNELNGAISVGTFDETCVPTTTDTLGYDLDNVVTMHNKIYTSEANNPYYFPVNGINTVGIGSIIGLASTTRALSQGQFGQFPLIAFSTDGIWALQVASSGTYSTIQPISREVCVNAASIAQLDQSVVFATDRALSKVVESSVAAFSDMLDGPFFNISEQLPRLAEYFASNAVIRQLIDFSTPPIDYFRAGSVLYDFVNNRLICLPATPSDEDITDGQEVALVYSIRDGAWSAMLVSTPLSVLNSYPYPYIQQRDGTVLVLDRKYDYTDTTLHPGIIVTRTLTFQGVMDAITGFEQMSTAQQPATLFLFGSNDNRSWHYIGRSARAHASYLPSHAFRFFRLALYLQMSQGEQYMQTDLTYIEKFSKL